MCPSNFKIGFLYLLILNCLLGFQQEEFEKLQILRAHSATLDSTLRKIYQTTGSFLTRILPSKDRKNGKIRVRKKP